MKTRLPWLLGVAAALLLGLSLVMLESFSPKTSPTAPGQAHSAAEEQPQAQEEDPWAQAWVNQQEYLQDIATSTEALRKSLPDLMRKLQSAVAPFDLETRRLFVLSTTYANNPRVLEAVERRIATAGSNLKEAMSPALRAKSSAEDLLEKITQLERTVPQEVRANVAPNKELRNYIDTIASVKKKLTDIVARLNNALSQGKVLEEKVGKAITGIDAYLPKLWETQYLTPPVRYTDPAHWKDLPSKLKAMAHNFDLRLVMEIPQSKQGWLAAGTRFASVAFFGAVLCMVFYRRLNRGGKGESFTHIFRSSLPWLITGVALVAASIATSTAAPASATNETATGSLPVYHTILALGNLILIVGQISLAWDLRSIDRADVPRTSPFWPLCLPTLAGYVLIYPDLPLLILTGCWTGVLILALLWRRFVHRNELSLQLESTFLQIDVVVLWIALFMAVFGLPRYSIIFYMLFTSLAVAIQLSMGGMHCIHAASQHMPKEGSRAVLGSIMVALAAPLVILLVLFGVALWIVTLPGGTYLLRSYAVSGVSVGATHFNFIQLLLIISVFYITRTAVSMGTRFITKLPSHGIRLDTSLIPPMQTAFTYGMWALFGAFVLKALGMELSSLAVVAGGLSVGIGFGMQAIVNNFLSGLILIFSRILQEGDVVDVGGLTGTVRKINVRATTVETYDNAVIYVPNSEFVSTRLINWTRNSRSVRREIAVGVAYGSDTTLVMRLLREVADGNPNVLKYPAPTVIFSNFGNNTLDFVLRFWVHDIDSGIPTASAIRLDLERVFRQNNVEVAFPQLDVHLKDVPMSMGGKLKKNAPPQQPVAPKVVARRLEDMEIERKPHQVLNIKPGSRRLLRRRVKHDTYNNDKEQA